MPATQKRAATRARTSHRSAPRVTSKAYVDNGAHSTPIIPSGNVEIRLRVGRYTFDATYALAAEIPADPTRWHFFSVTMTRPTGEELNPFELNETGNLTLNDVRALSMALPLIVRECERKMPAVLAKAGEMAETIERLGLNSSE